jgi:hypothetical protein
MMDFKPEFCDACERPFEEGDEVVTLQAVKDDEGNEIEGPVKYFHKKCLERVGTA